MKENMMCAGMVMVSLLIVASFLNLYLFS